MLRSFKSQPDEVMNLIVIVSFLGMNSDKITILGTKIIKLCDIGDYFDENDNVRQVAPL